MVNRVATFAYTNTMITENMRLQTKYADINTQISSGLKSQSYKGIARDSQYLLAIESSSDKLNAYNADANTALATINTMYSTMGSIDDLANSILSDITAALGGNAVTPAVMQNQAQIGMNELESLLNLRIAGRYAFSGTDIDTAPVNLADPGWVAQSAPSVANTSYYQGNSSVMSVQVSETMTVDYGVTANNSGFEKLLRAYNLVYNNPGSSPDLQEASTLVKTAIDEIANTRSVLSTHANTVQTQIDKNEQDKSYLDSLMSTIKETDIPTASVQLTEIQGQLEAAYSASARLLNLSLVKYLS